MNSLFSWLLVEYLLMFSGIHKKLLNVFQNSNSVYKTILKNTIPMIENSRGENRLTEKWLFFSENSSGRNRVKEKM